METEECLVICIDGVLVGGDEEQTKMLFYYDKSMPGNLVKGVVELRIPRSKFIDVVEQLNKKLQPMVKNKDMMFS